MADALGRHVAERARDLEPRRRGALPRVGRQPAQRRLGGLDVAGMRTRRQRHGRRHDHPRVAVGQVPPHERRRLLPADGRDGAHRARTHVGILVRQQPFDGRQPPGRHLRLQRLERTAASARARAADVWCRRSGVISWRFSSDSSSSIA